MYTNDKQDDWSEHLALAQFCHNDWENSSTGYTPFFLTYGKHPRKWFDPSKTTPVQAVTEFMGDIKDAWDKAADNLEKTAEWMAKQYDKGKRLSREYNIGDKVYVNAEHLPHVRASKKLDNKFYGPYKVIGKVGSAAYCIEIPTAWKVYNVFNEALLKPYHEPVFPEQAQWGKELEEKRRQEEEKVKGEEYEVEEILDSQIKGRGIQYLVKWKGYPVEESTWEPVGNLKNAGETVERFHQKHPNAPATRAIPQKAFRQYENFTQGSVPKKLFGWEDGKFDQEYQERLERKWRKWKGDRAQIYNLPEDDNQVEEIITAGAKVLMDTNL